VTISQKLSHYDSKLHLSIISSNDQLPLGVREFLVKQNINGNKMVKFPLSYFLVPESDTKFLRSSNFDSNINEQLFFHVSGVRNFKLFVHPDLDRTYSFLKNGYRYIGPNETEFFASPIMGSQTVIVWSQKNQKRTAFIVKSLLTENAAKEISSRFPATSNIAKPEMANLYFKRSIKNSKESIEGQQITSVPKL
jgi:hypothetical protein